MDSYHERADELEAAYASAWEEWLGSGEDDAWDATLTDLDL